MNFGQTYLYKNALVNAMREYKTEQEIIEWLARYELHIAETEDLVLNGTGEQGGFTGLLGDLISGIDRD